MEELRTAGLDRRFEELKRLGNHMESLWRDLGDFFLPTRARWNDSDPNNRGSAPVRCSTPAPASVNTMKVTQMPWICHST